MPVRYARRISSYRYRRDRFVRFACCVGCCLASLSLGAGLFLLESQASRAVFAQDKVAGIQAVTAAEKTPAQAEPLAVKSGWQLDENGVSFYLDQNGVPADGLTIVGDDTYFFEQGYPKTGFVHSELGIRFFRDDGVMMIGAFSFNGQDYFAGPDGVLAAGWTNTSGGLRYYNEDGALQSGLVQIDGQLSLLDENGAPVSGWSDEFDGIYWRDQWGRTVSGETEIDGVPYLFDDAGRLMTGLVQMSDGTRYYDADGNMATGEVSVNGNLYRFGEDGIMLESVKLSVPVIMQNPELPNGCEVTSLAEVLQFFGFDVSHTELAENYLPCGTITYQNGIMTVPDPEKEYVGNPATNSGWYCFEGPVIEAANGYLADVGSDMTAVSVTGADMDELAGWLQKGKPVIVWVTQQLADVRRTGYTWILPDGTTEHPYGGLHCVVLSGIDGDTVTLADPIYGEWEAELDRFAEIFAGMGSRAVVITDGE
ncbi:MAG TPA: C39 family peptidase [Candidatus Faecivivens stercoripullorum]|uniref:C39 family peptidase n=1 Tax=Candidatus Faecivivens stercoripullorum TaxID=2840805 RepID=A0A9D1H748_9FIRM|nr:C39 family peptidase [Candidatus Faecivivens stercoripullorum]